MNTENLTDVDVEKINRTEKFNRKSKTKYKRRSHFGEGKRLREEIETEEDPILEYLEGNW